MIQRKFQRRFTYLHRQRDTCNDSGKAGRAKGNGGGDGERVEGSGDEV